MPIVGCARKAPSPEQCLGFTELLMGASRDEVLEYPKAKAQFDLVVSLCLTTPFEQRVFSCVAESQAPSRCLELYMPELMSSRRGTVPVASGLQRR